ncbi:MAG: DJ-1/PfpI family protein [Actinomycetes bacterium]
MDVAFVLYPNMTALDLVGPYETLSGHPDVTPLFVAARVGKITCDSGMGLHADEAFADVTAPDMIVVPGSSHWRSALDDRELTDWIAAVHPRTSWTTSVCTGSTLLAKAGVLTGRPATTHWMAREVLGELGAVVSTDRVVIDGNVITAAGVSAGIDMGLTLAATLWGRETAQLIQLAIEYDPQPPFDAGSPDTAPPEIVAAARAVMGGQG